MKTRTLLLWSLGCGVAIIVAGLVFLFQLTGQDDLAEPVAIGEPVQVADMSVTVVDAAASGGELAVTVRIGGVVDDDGGIGFRLIASGRPVSASEPGPDGCSVTTSDVRECVVRFDVSIADGTSRVLFYDRGDEQARWVLS